QTCALPISLRHQALRQCRRGGGGPQPAGREADGLAMERRKLESAALFLTIFGAMLIMPPLVLLFNATTRVFGIPTEVIYLFAVWLTLIAATRWFSQIGRASCRDRG